MYNYGTESRALHNTYVLSLWKHCDHGPLSTYCTYMYIVHVHVGRGEEERKKEGSANPTHILL